MNDLDFIAAQMVGRRKAGADRERLAHAAHLKKAAKHKGRNHWRNWERRAMAAQKKRECAAKLEAKKPILERYRKQVRAYWSGLRSDLPVAPR